MSRSVVSYLVLKLLNTVQDRLIGMGMNQTLRREERRPALTMSVDNADLLLCRSVEFCSISIQPVAVMAT